MHAPLEPVVSSSEEPRPSDFEPRHTAPNPENIQLMLQTCGTSNLDVFTAEILPEEIPSVERLQLPEPSDEMKALEELKLRLTKNKCYRSLIGMGYSDCITPTVILRNILENPGWYTSYTPYQAEISQGRLEAMLNFQTMVTDLTGMDVANASLLDEGTAAAEAVTMCFARRNPEKSNLLLVDSGVLPQTAAVVTTRCQLLGIALEQADLETVQFESKNAFAVLISCPAADGKLKKLEEITERAQTAGARVIVVADLLSLTLFKPPGQVGSRGADVVVGSAQRFGVPMGYGGPHAAFFATRDEFKRLMPGRVVGISRDADGQPAYRLAMQTREQHIRRDKATSNICTAQVLLAVIAAMTAIYHGPHGLRNIALRIHGLARQLARLTATWKKTLHSEFFDTLCWDVTPEESEQIRIRAAKHKINLNHFLTGKLTVTLDEKTSAEEVLLLAEILTGQACNESLHSLRKALEADCAAINTSLRPATDYLTHPVFNSYHSEHAMLRYLKRLENKDISLTHSMIPLGSCTMKLNSTSEMIPLTWPENCSLHPLCPPEQAKGTREIVRDLEKWLGEITGLPAVSLQPNAGSQGEFAGLQAIRKYHQARGEDHRRVCLIPVSAHGTNPASAVMAGLRVVPVTCDEQGNISHADLKEKISAHSDELAAIMVTYPSTHGVFESGIRELCRMVHKAGALVYMDGANMNAQVGLCRPGDFGVDVCHLNLHKTFCIPHGGGGPGVGPICATKKLRPYLPGHCLINNGAGSVNAVASAPWGSASLLVIPWMYIRMMGATGLKRATQVAILSANYIAKRLSTHYPVLYTGRNGRVAHECILDLRQFKKIAGIEAEDVAKRLMDFGFHAPTMSWPVPGTLMIEPTESEPLDELDRFCEAMIAIRQEIEEIIQGKLPPDDNPLKNAPHTAAQLLTEDWTHPYSRQRAAYPLPWVHQRKFWPPVRRIDNVWGDRNVICTCASVEELAAITSES